MLKCKCKCKNSYFGDGKNKTTLLLPSNKYATIDKCIVETLKYLWLNNVTTLNSCCGHNILKPSVIVDEYSIKKMFLLGYKAYINNCGALIFLV